MRRGINDAAKVRPATIADLLAIPAEDRRHEVIDGVLVEKEAARHGVGHHWIVDPVEETLAVYRSHADGLRRASRRRARRASLR